MLTLVINNEKCITLDLSKEPSLVLTFFLKSYTTFRLSNFTDKFFKKNHTFITQS